MKRPTAPLLIVATFFLAACNRGLPTLRHRIIPASPPSSRVKTRSSSPLAEQANGMIETKPVILSDEPNTLRVTGRIALADDRTGGWACGLKVWSWPSMSDWVTMSKKVKCWPAITRMRCAISAQNIARLCQIWID